MAEKMEGMPSSWPYSQQGLAARAALLNLHKLPKAPLTAAFVLPFQRRRVPGGRAEEEDKEN